MIVRIVWNRNPRKAREDSIKGCRERT